MRGSSGQRGSTLAEFALAWPLVLLITCAAIELALWSALAAGARSAALAGARAGATAQGTESLSSSVALATLRPVAFGLQPAAWCPGGAAPPPVWVCSHDFGSGIEVTVGGSAPALVPLLPAAALPIHADVTVNRERFS